MEQVLHFHKADSRSSSRIQMQKSLVKSFVYDYTKNLPMFFAILPKLMRKPKALVFHGQSTLPLLLFVSLVKVVFRLDYVVVYDMHDLHELPNNKNLKTELRYYIFYLLEYFASRCDIRTISVSKGLCRLYYLRYRRRARLVYNIPQSFDLSLYKKSDKQQSKRRGDCIVYFGLIDKDRLPIDKIRQIFKLSNKLRFDIYGKFSTDCDDDYKDQFQAVLDQGQLIYKGRFLPDDLSFLENYNYSWMNFNSSKVNIRFCMPNKLFQATQYGVRCIISDNLHEAHLTLMGMLIRYDEFISNLQRSPDFLSEGMFSYDDLIDKKLIKMFHLSRRNYLKACNIDS